MKKIEDHNFARGDPFKELSEKFNGSCFTKYGHDHIEFDLRLNGPDNGKFRITGTVEQVKRSLQMILERFDQKSFNL